MTTLTNEDVEEIVRILDASPYDELTLRTARFELSLRRGEGGWTQERRTLGSPRVLAAAAAPAETAAAADAAERTEEAEGVFAIRAPMVGTFYRAPKPGALPFVEPGAEVGEHTVVGIIETMKLMNSIPAGASGTVIEICVADGELVQAGRTLMRLRLAAS